MSFQYTNNPVKDFEAHDSDQQKWLEKLPKCCECGEPVQQDRAVNFNGEYVCDSCLEDLRVEIMDFYG